MLLVKMGNGRLKKRRQLQYCTMYVIYSLGTLVFFFVMLVYKLMFVLGWVTLIPVHSAKC